MDMDEILSAIIVVAIVIVVIAVLSILVAFPVKWCWNYVMPYLFGLPVLNWGRAWCITFLCGVLLKSSSSSSSK